VFLDVHSIPPGANFREVLDEAVRKSDVVLAMIGKTWCDGGIGTGGVNDPEDYVRAELEAALQHEVAIIPVLVHEASMPKVASLPNSLRPLPGLQALEVGGPGNFQRHVDRIVARMNEVADVYVRRTVRRHRQLISGLGSLPVKMVTKNGALITSEDGRGFSVFEGYRDTVADWDASEDYYVVLGLVNSSRGELAVVAETLTLDATQFDTEDPAILDKIEKFRRDQDGEDEH
jgi:hypothetical protein